MTSTKESPSRLRTVRSFVRRAGRLTTSQQRALEELWPAFGIEFSNEPLQFDILFGRAAPVVLEIGFGNGETLVQQAAEFPEADFLGIEVHEPGVGHCLLKAQDAGVSNLRLIRHDAVEVLDAMIPAGSLSRVNLYFPDPWPKKRHHRRRFVTPEHLDPLARCLKVGAIFRVATDIPDYVRQTLEQMMARDDFEWLAEGPDDWRKPWSDWISTRYELKALREGRTPQYLTFRRI